MLPNPRVLPLSSRWPHFLEGAVMLCFPSLPGGKLALLLRRDSCSVRAPYGASGGKVYSGLALRVLLLLLLLLLLGDISKTAQ